MSSFLPPADTHLDLGTLPRARYLKAMSNFAAQTFRPDTIEECQRRFYIDKWLQQAILPPDQRQWTNQELLDTRMIGRDLDVHGEWRYRAYARGQIAIWLASQIPSSTRLCWTSCFERLYDFGEDIRGDQVAATRQNLQQLKELFEAYVEVAQTVSDWASRDSRPR